MSAVAAVAYTPCPEKNILDIFDRNLKKNFNKKNLMIFDRNISDTTGHQMNI